MKENRKTTIQTDQPISLTKAVLIGAGIGLALIAFFLSGVGDPHPDWPQYWYIRPLIIVPLAGATGGAVFHFLDYLSSQRGFNKTLAILLGFAIYLIGLWLGFILGLDGTLWN